MEQDFINWLKETLPISDVCRGGIGDDAAVVEWTGRDDIVVTSDLLAEGTHFVLADHSAEMVGRKALAVNLSDLAAMGARSVAVTVSLLLPRADAAGLAKRIIKGMLPLCEHFRTAIVGGDTNTWDHGLVINVTAFGQLEGKSPLTRSGARPGDALLVTGELGGSLTGNHFVFVPRIDEAIQLRQFDVHACMDISDGLSLDLSRMVRASGCGAELDLDAVPISPAAHEISRQEGAQRTPLEHALSDGEDFELLLAVPKDVAERLIDEQPLTVTLTRIGQFVEGEGLWCHDESNGRQRLAPEGYEH